MSDDNDVQLALKKLLDQNTIADALFHCATDYPHVGGNGPFNKQWEMTLAAAVIKALERRALLHLLDLPIQDGADRRTTLVTEARQKEREFMVCGHPRASFLLSVEPFEVAEENWVNACAGCQRDERLRLEARREQHRQDCRWALTSS